MKLITRQLPTNCEIALHGDSHEGDILMHRKGLEGFVRWVKAKRNRYFIHMGDAAECITVNDKRYNSETSDKTVPSQQEDSVVERYIPIKNRGIVWLKGNHEHTVSRTMLMAQNISRRLSIPYGTWTAKVRIVDSDGKQMFKMYLAHGVGRSITSNAKDHEQRVANMQAGFKRKLVNKASDCLVMAGGHFHKLINVPPSEKLVLTDDGKKLEHSYLTPGDGSAAHIEPDRRWYVCTGSFVRLQVVGIDGYAERAGYDPVELGWQVVKVRGGKVVAVERVVI